MNALDREKAAIKAQVWRTQEGAALGKVEELRVTLRRAGEYTAWLEAEWMREQSLRIQLERELALRAVSGVHSSLPVGELVEKLRDHLRIALERAPDKLELAVTLLARPVVDRVVRDALAICSRWIGTDQERAHARAEVEAAVRKIMGEEEAG